MNKWLLGLGALGLGFALGCSLKNKIAIKHILEMQDELSKKQNGLNTIVGIQLDMTNMTIDIIHDMIAKIEELSDGVDPTTIDVSINDEES